MRFTAVITHESPWYFARCLEVEVASQGETVKRALASLKEALELYFKDATPPETIEPAIIATVELSA
jgi:predicted RNase H-like HicB family nuclease